MQRSTFLQYLKFEKRFSTHTITAYNSDISQFEAFLQEQFNLSKLQEVSHVHIRTWIVNLMQSNISTRSINRKLSSLKCFFKFLNKRGGIASNPTLKIVSPKSGKALPSFVRKAEITKLFESELFEASYSGIRDHTILETLYSAGLRRSELINMKVNDIDFNRKIIKVLGKRNKSRVVPLSLALETRLRRYLEIRDEHFTQLEYLFLTEKGQKLYPKLVYNLVKKYLAVVTDIKKKSPHILRHSFATHILENGGQLNSIKELLGHSSLAATQIYTHNSIEQLKSAYLNAHPKSKL